MSQAERISRIHFLLRAKEVVSLREMKDTFEVSRSTLMRDIELLRDRLGAPIVYDAGRNGYRLDLQDRAGEPVDELPGLWLTAREGYALLTMYNVVKDIDPGFLMSFLGPMRLTLKRMLISLEFQMWDLDRKVAIDFPDFLRPDLWELDSIFSALVKEEVVRLKWAAPDGQERDAECRVLRLILQPVGWLLTIEPTGDDPVHVRLIDVISCEGASGWKRRA